MKPGALLLPLAVLAFAGRVAGDEPPQRAPVPPASRVVAAVTAAAIENAKAPASKRLSSDALGDFYAQKAALAAEGDLKAFVVGMAHLVDPSSTLAKFPLTASAFLGIETPPDAEKRTAAWGKPSMRSREDWLQHFWTSAALLVLVGEAPARLAGITKEMSDMGKGGGFSFADLLADEAGISFAKFLQAKDTAKRLEWTATSFSGNENMPDPADFPDSVLKADFEKKYGSASDKRFQKMQAKIAAEIAKVAAEREKKATPKR